MPSLRIVAAVLLIAAVPSAAVDPRPPAMGAHAMVATAQHDATAAGLSILREGGNAIDAAVAIAYALAVTHPCCGNIGGGGFMLVRMHDGREAFIDFREKAPLRARRDMYLNKSGAVVPHASTDGFLAVGVPGTVMGMERARSLFGTLPRTTLMEPAIALARGGFVLTPPDVRNLSGAPRAFLGANGTPFTGEHFVQRDLAASLEAISKGGAAAFYRGSIARAVVRESERHGGILSMQDFAQYTVDAIAPIHCRYRGYEIISAPPPSSGGITLCETLNIIAPYRFASWGWNAPQSVHITAEAERRAYADRNTYLGDPAFVRNPTGELLSPGYAARLRSTIEPNRATPSDEVKPGLGAVSYESAQTTHFSVVDRYGNAVAVTYTINDGYGAKVMAAGFLLNDEMDDFTSKPGVPNLYGLVQGVRNGIQPGKRPLSSMTPTIVTRNGKLFMVTGSPGGSHIITIVLNTLQNVIDYGMNAQAAVDAPRTHMQWLPDALQYEPGAFTAAQQERLRAMGYHLVQTPAWGSAEAIVVDPHTGTLYGGSDRRAPAGSAAGY